MAKGFFWGGRGANLLKSPLLAIKTPKLYLLTLKVGEGVSRKSFFLSKQSIQHPHHPSILAMRPTILSELRESGCQVIIQQLPESYCTVVMHHCAAMVCGIL